MSDIWRPNKGPQERFVACGAFEALYGGAAGGGKGARLDAVVYTPFGPRRIGDLRVGDQLCSADGGVERVLQIWDRGRQPCFRFTFTDGASTIVDSDHLWWAWEAGKPSDKAERTAPGGVEHLRGRIYATHQIKQAVERAQAARGDGRRAHWPIVPLADPVCFSTPRGRWEDPRTVDPYLLGALLGDGTITERSDISIATKDNYLLWQLGLATPEHQYRGGPVSWRLTNHRGLKDRLRQLGVLGHAHTKFVPGCYKLAPAPVRWAIVQGLFDTDGYADARGHCSFTSVSKQLVDDVQWICRSLGFKASITSGPGSYRNEVGERVECREAFTVYVQGATPSELFRLPRKKARCNDRFNGGASKPGRRLVAVDPMPAEETRCIVVDHPLRLYVTDDFIVTHNSEALLMSAVRHVAHPHYRALLLRRTYPELKRSLIDRSLEIYPRLGGEYNVTDKTWSFPGGGPGGRGGKVEFGQLEGDKHVMKYASAEYQFLGFDELTTFCMPSDTDVLTETGWKSIADCAVGERVMSLTPNGEAELRAVTARHEQQYAGELLSLHQRKGVAFDVTPDHRMVVQRQYDKGTTKWRFCRAKDLPAFTWIPRTGTWNGVELAPVELPIPRGRGHGANNNCASLPVAPEDWLALLGWFLAEGSAWEGRGHRTPTVDIAQYADGGPLRQLLDRLPWRFTRHKRGYRIFSRQLYEALAPLGRSAHDKRVPRWLMGLSARLLRYFFDAFVAGDGHVTNTGAIHIGLCNDGLIDDLQEICVRLGRVATKASAMRKTMLPSGKPFEGMVHTLTVSKPGRSVCEVRRSSIQRRSFQGRVYCISVDGNGTFMARTRGRMWWSGNSEFQYVFLISRLRSPHGIPLYLRAGTNPGGEGHDWVLGRFAPWLYDETDETYKGPRARAEERLHYRFDEEMGHTFCRANTAGAKSRTFFPALVADNPYLAGTDYEVNLDALDRLTRRRLKFGDWMARPTGGMFFEKHWFEIVDAVPAGVLVRLRYWDRASSKKGGADYTAGVRLSYSSAGFWFIEDVVRFQGRPHEVEGAIKTVSGQDMADDSHIMLFLEQDPGSAGNFETEYYSRQVELVQAGIRFTRPDTDKISRAMPMSAQAEAGNIRLVRGAWNAEYLRELQGFPEGHDDQVDASSGGMRQALHFAAYLKRPGGQVRVITPNDPDEENLAEEELAEIEEQRPRRTALEDYWAKWGDSG